MEKAHNTESELTCLSVSTSADPATEATVAADTSETPLPNPSPSWAEPARRERTGRRLAAAALATAAVAAAGLASTERVVAGRAVISTDGQAEATAAAMHEAEKNDAALRMAAASAHDNWISIQGESGSVPFGVIAPGAVISGVDKDGDMADCTVGLAIRGGVITGGHCATAGTPRYLSDGRNGALSAQIGTVMKSVDVIPETGPTVDASAVTVTAPTTDAAVRVAGRPVAGVMTMDAVHHLPAGTPVCFDGASSGLKCGPLRYAYGSVTIGVKAQHGDSGGPVFLVDGTSGAVTLVGVLTGGTDTSTRAAYVDSALDSLGAVALVDPTAAATVAGDPRYSTRVAPLN